VAVSIGKDKTTIYIDGEEAASSTSITIRPSDIRPVLNYLGRSQFNSDPYLSAYFDDVRVCNFAATADEVKQMMEGQLSGIQVPSAETAAPVVYGVDGVRRSAVRSGLNIVDGRKVVVK
jgi:hypothetical protein